MQKSGGGGAGSDPAPPLSPYNAHSKHTAPPHGLLDQLDLAPAHGCFVSHLVIWGKGATDALEVQIWTFEDIQHPLVPGLELYLP